MTIYPCGQMEPYTKCKTIESHKPDYIFVQNPYNVYNNSILDPYFIDSTLKKIAKKTVYISYGSHIFHQYHINNKCLPNIMDLVFVDSESTKDIYIEKWVKLQKRGKSELGVGIAVNFFSVIEKYPAISYLTQMPYPCRMIMFYAFIFWYI